MKTIFFILFIILAFLPLYSFDFVIVKYKSGDYYNARDGVKNFLTELKKRTTIEVNETVPEVSLDDDAIFQYYFLFINGHVPIQLSEKEKDNLRKFILNGGFIYANDDYGIDESFRKLIKDIFPEYPLQEVDFADPIYHSFYEIKNGVPKIHEHYEGAPKAYGLFINSRIVLYYTYNSDIPDGWDAPEVHNDPPGKREEAFRIGVNIVVYSLTH